MTLAGEWEIVREERDSQYSNITRYLSSYDLHDGGAAEGRILLGNWQRDSY